MGPRAGLDGRKNLVPTGIRSRTVQPIVNIHESSDVLFLKHPVYLYHCGTGCWFDCRRISWSYMGVSDSVIIQN